MGAGEAADHCSMQGFTSSPITSLSQGAAVARNRKRWKGPFLFQEQAEKGFCVVHPVGSVLGPRCQGAGFPPPRTVWGPVFPGPLGGRSHWQPGAGGPHSQPGLSPHRAPPAGSTISAPPGRWKAAQKQDKSSYCCGTKGPADARITTCWFSTTLLCFHISMSFIPKSGV